jgi:hypothetical protein
MGNPNSTNLKSNSAASFQSILEEVYAKTEPVPSEPTNHLEWISVIESTHLLNRLFETDLRIAKKASPKQTPYSKLCSTKKFHTQRLNPEMGLQSENPDWSIEAKQAFVFINTLPINNTNTPQDNLPVFFTHLELKKIYRQRAKLTHPDHNGGSHTQFIELKRNCQILMDFSKKID